MEDKDLFLDKATYEKLTKEFAEITKTNEALAHTFLQDYEWNLKKSVEAFFEALNEESKQNNQPIFQNKPFTLNSSNSQYDSVASNSLYDTSIGK